MLAGGLLIVPASNFAISWKHSLNTLIDSQSAGNLNYLNLLRLPREYTQEIVSCYSTLPMVTSSSNYGIRIKKNYKFGSYLTGLIEGDGSIFVPQTERSSKGKLNYPSIQIVFHLKDLPLALLIQKNLGYGSLMRKKGLNAYILSINDQRGILNLVNLLNGNMRTPKIHSLYKLIDWLNNNNPNLNLTKLSLKSDPLNSDA